MRVSTSQIYALGAESIDPADAPLSIADFFIRNIGHHARPGDTLPFGPIALVATKVANGHVTTAGLRLAEPEPAATPRLPWLRRLRRQLRRGLRALGKTFG